ncbi:MAG: hypothetical protein DMG97_10610, partial [Acidobacteria bacterium]
MRASNYHGLHKSRPLLCSPHPDSSQLNQLRFKTVYTLAASRCGSLGEIRNVSSRLPSCAHILFGRQRFRPGLRPELIVEIADAVGGGCSHQAQPSPNFNADTATNAYLAQIPAAARARSDAYFEGGSWIILWDFIYGFVVALLLLNLRWSARMRDLAERITRFMPIHAIVYWIE